MRRSSILAQVSLSLLVSLFGLPGNASSCGPGVYNNPPFAWPQGTTVYYSTKGLTSLESTALANAVGQWNTANQSNGSNVQFVPSTSSNPPTYLLSSGTATAPGGTQPCTPNTLGPGATCTVTPQGSSTLTGAVTVIPPNSTWLTPTQPGYQDALVQAFLHELGHTMGLGDQGGTMATTVMNQFIGINDSGGAVSDKITTCDNNAIQTSTYYTTACAQTFPAPVAQQVGYWYQLFPAPVCAYELENDCPPGGCLSPIVIDTDGSGFHLTSASEGVMFDFFGTGKPIQIAWTESGSTNGWLALDRNGNGTIDSAGELFGNITAQPPSNHPNGFLALAVFDLPENGGNGDGVIDSRDAIWPQLLVWIDSNHDGISQSWELHHLDDMGIHSIALRYVETPFTDAYGNHFRYRGSLNPDKGDDVDRVIYDVFLVTNLAHESASVRPREFRWLDPAEVLPLRVRRSFEE